MDAVERARRLLSEVREGEAFRLADGRLIRSLRELAVLLDTLDEELFRHHVNEIKNDFALWIEQSIGDAELASRLRMSSDYAHFYAAIRERIAELEADLLAAEAPSTSSSSEMNAEETARHQKTHKHRTEQTPGTSPRTTHTHSSSQTDLSEESLEDSQTPPASPVSEDLAENLAEAESLLEEELRELEALITQTPEEPVRQHSQGEHYHTPPSHTAPHTPVPQMTPTAYASGDVHTISSPEHREDSSQHTNPPSSASTNLPIPRETAHPTSDVLPPMDVPGCEKSFYWTDFLIGLAAGILIGVLTTILYTILTSGGV